jgi:anion-transporting  ArsA/GET3 family ATPase
VSAPAVTSVAGMAASELFSRILRDKRVVVACGSGGVGKTTTSAALGLFAALAGKRALVLTIDPARRLANALGLESFGNEARVVPLGSLGLQAAEGGSLSAMMLDMKQTFDDMVADYATAPGDLERIRQNRLYRSMSQALAGIQEYMAVAKLYDVLQTGAYDLIVLDTPPTSHALDFLDAPRRFVDFLDHDALQWLLKSTATAGKIGFRLLDVGSSYVMKTLGRLAGIDILRDIGEFVASFYPLFLGFKDRAEKIQQLLLSRDLGFLVVSAPTHPQVDEALFFHRKLQHEGLRALSVVVNRLHRALPEEAIGEQAEAALERLLGDPTLAQAAATAGRDHNALVVAEQTELRRLKNEVHTHAPVCGVYELEEDVHSLAGLFAMGKQIFTDGG